MSKKKGAGKFGSKYGKKVRDNFLKIEKLQKSRKKCPKCGKMSLTRNAAGIWICKSCGAKIVGGAYVFDISSEKLFGSIKKEV